MPISRQSALPPRQRVLAAARGQPHDRPPVMLWLNPHAACKLMAEIQPARSRLIQTVAGWLWRQFTSRGGMDAPELWRALPLLVSGYANRDYVAQLGSDLVIQSVGNPLVKTWWEEVAPGGQRALRFLDIFGSVQGMGGIYTYPIRPAIRSPKDLADYRGGILKSV